MALSGNGTTDNTAHANVFNPTGAPLTVSVWIFIDSTATLGGRIWIVHNAGDTDRAVAFMTLTSGSDNLLRFVVGCSVTALVHDSSTIVSTGVWHHVLVTWDGSNTAANARIYLDGTEVSYGTTTNGSGTQTAGTGLWGLLGNTYSDANCLPGKLASVGVWTRVVSAAEIAALAKGYSPLFFLDGLEWAPHLIRNVNDPIGGKTQSLDGTTITAHPRIILPSGPPILRMATGAVATGARRIVDGGLIEHPIINGGLVAA